VNSRVLRLKRNKNEIRPPPAFRMLFDGCAESIIENMLFKSRASIIFNKLIKSFKSAAKRLRDVYIRRLFIGLSDLCMLNNLFFNFVAFWTVFFTRIYYACALAASRLRFAASTAFYAR
jgi:hypothetical protein